jgi:dolichol-phosphate mannosyltransferase
VKKGEVLQISSSRTAVLIATLNEEEGIGPTIKEIKRFLKDAYILVVDGRSTDKTVEIAKDLGADVIFQDGKGKGDAIRKGIKHLAPDFRYFVLIDADFTYPAEYIPKMIRALENDSSIGMVLGNRFNEEFSFRDSSNSAFYTGNRLLAFAQHLVNGIRLADPLSGLRVARWDIMKCWNPKSDGFDIEAEMNYLVERSKCRMIEIPIEYRPRLGEKKLKFKHGFSILKRMLSESLVEHAHSAFYS